jgi:hypothetical protein
MRLERLHQVRLESMSFYPINIEIIKSRRMEWPGLVARMREKCMQGIGRRI